MIEITEEEYETLLADSRRVRAIRDILDEYYLRRKLLRAKISDGPNYAIHKFASQSFWLRYPRLQTGVGMANRVYKANVFMPDGINVIVGADTECDAIEQARLAVEKHLTGYKTVRANNIDGMTYYAIPLERDE